MAAALATPAKCGVLRNVGRLPHGGPMPRPARSSTSSRSLPASSGKSRPIALRASSTSAVLRGSAAAGIGPRGRVDRPDAGIGAVGGMRRLSNYTSLGGSLTVYALPQ